MHFEKKLDSELIFQGKIFDLTKDTVELENGKTSTREVVHHSGGVCVCAMDDDGNVYFVRQYRYAHGRELLELPAGKREKNEDPLEGALRELSEEVGCDAKTIVPLPDFLPSSAYVTEVIKNFYATGLSFHDQHLDEDEFVTPEKIPLKKAVDMVLTGEIKDGKTQAILLTVNEMLGRGDL